MIVTHNSDTTTDLNDETLLHHGKCHVTVATPMAAAALPRGCVLHIAATPEALGPLVADRLCGAVSRAPAGYIGLATGATPLRIGLWAELSRRCRVGGAVDASHATFVNPDEWLGLPAGHPEAYASYLARHLPWAHLAVPTDIAGARAIEFAAGRAGGFEFFLLGMGLNGHIGFFEPCVVGIPAVAYEPAIAPLNRERYAVDHFGSLDAVPTHAVTIGLASVMRARELCLLVVGEQKAALLARALQGPVTTALPASLLQLAPCVSIFVDAHAATELDVAALAARPGWAVVNRARGAVAE